MNAYLKNKTIIEKLLFAFLCVLNVLFLVYWIFLASNYCLHFDDAHFMWKLREYSMFEYIKEMYMTRGGNFVSYGQNAIIFSLSNLLCAYRFWPILFYCIGILLVYVTVKDVKWPIGKFDLFLIVVTFYNVYVLTSVDFAVFTWICAMSYYLYAPAICLIIKYIHEEKLAWWQSCLLFVLALFIAGNSVSISTVSFVVLLAVGLYFWHSKAWNLCKTWQMPQVQRLFFLTLFMLVAFAIVVVAPGNYSRMESECDIEQPKNVLEFIIACAKCAGMFEYMMIFYLSYYALLFALGYWIGTKSTYNYAISRRKLITIILGIYIFYVLISVMPLAYLSNGFQIQRNYTQISFFHIAGIFVMGYTLGSGKELQRLKGQVSSLFFTFFMVVIIVLNIHQDAPVAYAYRKAHEERETYLLELQNLGNKEKIYVMPYPSVSTPDAKYNILSFFGKTTNMQSIYYFSDTGYNPNEYESHIRHLLNLDFNFVLVKNDDTQK